MERHPTVVVDQPPQEVMEHARHGAKNWQTIVPQTRDLCEQALCKIKERCLRRRILLRPAFKDYDTHNSGHVSRGQMRQCLITYGVLLSDEELYSLEQRYNDDLGFNYLWFLKDAGSKLYEEPLVS